MIFLQIIFGSIGKRRTGPLYLYSRRSSMSSASVWLSAASVRKTPTVIRLLGCVLMLSDCLLLMGPYAGRAIDLCVGVRDDVDRSGGLVPDVQVRVINVDTNVVTATKTKPCRGLQHAEFESRPVSDPGDKGWLQADRPAATSHSTCKTASIAISRLM